VFVLTNKKGYVIIIDINIRWNIYAYLAYLIGFRPKQERRQYQDREGEYLCYIMNKLMNTIFGKNNKKSAAQKQTVEVNSKKLLGSDLSFAASEAYKRLRTNLVFSFAGETGCRVIGVTSSLRGEGKSTTSVNLAYSLATMNKSTLLIDADMRLSNTHKLLELNLAPGLSNLLVGVNDGTGLIVPSKLHRNLMVMTAGDTPPNPMELLSSKRMVMTLESLRAKFDYIIIDLPPIDAVADALIVSKLVDGMVLVIRENYVDKHTLDNCIEQLRFHNANILGFVMNCAEVENKYYRKNYYRYGNNSSVGNTAISND